MKEADNEQYLKRGTLAVLGVMKELLRKQTPVMVNFSQGQFLSYLLAADSEQLILDPGSNHLMNQQVMECGEVNISADTQGARVEFSLGKLKRIEHDGLPAFSAPLPELLWQIQRREFFRVRAPMEPLFWCHSQWPDGSAARFRLQDVSLGGISVLVDEALPQELDVGDMFKSLRVELGEYGQFTVEAQLLHIGKHSVVTSKNETRVMPRLSLRFTAIEPLQARQLQQVIFALERLARDKANRFQ